MCKEKGEKKCAFLAIAALQKIFLKKQKKVLTNGRAYVIIVKRSKMAG